jgi:hypothetical protein
MTTINDKINRAKELIAQREAIDTELAALFNGGGAVPRRTITCSVCGGEGHTARTCSNKEKSTAVPEPTVPPKPIQFL